MDTSETYIKMCKKAEEIQELKHKEISAHIGDWAYITNYEDWDGNYVFDPVISKVELHCADCNTEYGGSGLDSRVIWLPRQDQLQEMSGLDWRSFDKKCLVYENPVLVPTKEQAGVRVVMREKHCKVWSRKDWSS